MQDNNKFTYRRSGSTGCEILDSDGNVVAWAMDELWAVVIVAGLNSSATAEKMTTK